MQQAVGKIVDGFEDLDATAPSITAADSMSSIADKVNDAFGDAAPLVEDFEDITAADSMSEVADKVDGNFGKLADELSSGTFTFLHTSDPHGYTRNNTGGVQQMVSMMNNPNGYNYRFGCISGDLKAYTGTTRKPSIYDSMLKGCTGMQGGKLIVIGGNHDACDRWTSDSSDTTNYACYDQVRMTNWLKGLLGSEAIGNKVNWGDTNGVVNTPITSAYYYQDFIVGRKKVRVICMEQYDFDLCLAEHNAANPSDQKTHRTEYYTYYTAYSQQQVDWFVDLLKHTDSSYRVIIVTHDGVAIQKPTVYDNGEFVTDALFFTSDDANYAVNGGDWIPKVVDAWMNNKAINVSFTGKVPHGTSTSAVFDHVVTVNDTFVGVDTGKLICYLAGHTHYDYTYWCHKTNYPNQLQLIITAATSNVEYANYDDLLSNTSNKTQVVPSEPAYRLNRVTYDIEAHTVLVERIGQQTAALKSDTSKTRVRDRLLFNLETMEVTHPNS